MCIVIAQAISSFKTQYFAKVGAYMTVHLFIARRDNIKPFPTAVLYITDSVLRLY